MITGESGIRHQAHAPLRPMSETGKPPRLSLRSHLWAAWLALTLVFVAATNADPDLWGHLRFGLDWWTARTWPTLDPYSFTQDRPWINHEWLSEVSMAVAYLLGGPPALVLLKIAVLAPVFVLIGTRLRGLSAPMTCALLVLAIVSLLPISLTIRPQLWSVLGLTLLAYGLTASPDPGPARTLALIGIFAVWANLHGGWITGAAVLVAYASGRSVTNPRSALRWVAVVGVSLTATSLNPYGTGLWRFLGTTVRPARPDITEWQPLAFDSPAVLWLPIVAISGLTLALARRRNTRPPLEIVAPVIVLLLGAIRVHRVAPLVAPAALIFLGPYMARSWGHLAPRLDVDRAAWQVLWAPVLVMFIAAAGPLYDSLKCISVTGPWVPDLAAARYLRGPQGRLWSTFNWGQYAIWHFGPSLLVSIDGRRETVYSEEVVRVHREFESGNAEAQTRFSSLAPDFVWLPAARTTAKQWLKDHGYRIDVDTGVSFIAVRGDLPPLVEGAPMPSCFP